MSLITHIAVIDTSSDQLVDLIHVGDAPFISDVAVSRDGSRVYASVIAFDGAPGWLAVIDTVTRGVIATVPLGVEPHAIAPSADGSTVYVAVNGGGSSPSGVWIIETATNAVVDVIPLDGLPSALALSDDARCLYVGHLAGAFTMIEIGSRQWRGFSIEGAGIDSMVLSPYEPTAYVANGPGGGVGAVNFAALTARTSPIEGENVQVVVLRPGTRELWATATENGLFIVDLTTGALQHLEFPGDNLVGIDFTPDGAKAFIGDGASDNPEALVIDGATRTLRARIALPQSPYSKGHFITFPLAGRGPADNVCRRLAG